MVDLVTQLTSDTHVYTNRFVIDLVRKKDTSNKTLVNLPLFIVKYTSWRGTHEERVL